MIVNIKKAFLLSGLLLMFSTVGFAQAQSFFIFEKKGNKITFPIEQTRSLSFVNSSLTVNMNSGEVYSFPFVNLWKMTFGNFTNVRKNEAATSVTVFPNPATDFVNISLNNDATAQELDVKVRTIDGKLIYRQSYKNNFGDTYQLNISDWSKGVYIMHISDGKNTEIKRIIKK